MAVTPTVFGATVAIYVFCTEQSRGTAEWCQGTPDRPMTLALSPDTLLSPLQVYVISATI